MGAISVITNSPLSGTVFHALDKPLDLYVWGTDHNDILRGGTGENYIFGGAGNDILYGGPGKNYLDGGTGADTMYGGYGNTTYIVDNPGDRTIHLHGSTGIDTVKSSISWTLGAGIENLTLTGVANINGTGNNLGNVLVGNSGNNVLTGGAGNDTLYGGGGHDILTGGLGADTFVFHHDTAYNGPATITDFKIHQGDKLDISDLLSAYDPLTKALSDFVHITDNGYNNCVLSVDADGKGKNFSFQPVAILHNFSDLPELHELVAHGNLVV